MGSFSWLRADKLGKYVNIYGECAYKCLLPKEFDETGVGFIRDHYQGYGELGTDPDGSPKYDMYELLAIWNASMTHRSGLTVGEMLKGVDFAHPLKEIDMHTKHNRTIGIEIGCHDSQIARLERPLKLVSVGFKGTYEECEGRSYSDREQGFYHVTRESYERDFQYRRSMSFHWLFEDVKDISALCIAALTEAGKETASKFASEDAIRAYINQHYPDVPCVSGGVIGAEAYLAVTVDALRSMPACKNITFDFRAEEDGACLYVNGEPYSGTEITKAVGEPGREENCKWLESLSEKKQHSKPKKTSFERE